MITSLFPHLFDYQFLAPTLLRLVLAAVFIVHGYPKLFAPAFHSTAEFLGSLGFKPAKFWAAVLGGTEFFGGILLLVGLFTQVASALIAFVTLVAIFKVKRKQGFAGGWEFDLVLLVIAVSLMLTGPGAYALDLPF